MEGRILKNKRYSSFQIIFRKLFINFLKCNLNKKYKEDKK